MTDAPECPTCDFVTLEPKKSVENNEVIEDGWYCPDCESTYDGDTVFSWEDVDWPVWIEYESYNDTWRMYDLFLRQTGIHEDAMPDGFTEMKYTVFSVWFKITEDGTVHGPYDDRNGELI